MKALRRQLMAAIAMVLVAAIALGSSTYAWFAQNTKVTASEVTVVAQTAKNLSITLNGKGATDWATSVTLADPNAGKTDVSGDGVVRYWPVSATENSKFIGKTTETTLSANWTGEDSVTFYSIDNSNKVNSADNYKATVEMNDTTLGSTDTLGKNFQVATPANYWKDTMTLRYDYTEGQTTAIDAKVTVEVPEAITSLGADDKDITKALHVALVTADKKWHMADMGDNTLDNTAHTLTADFSSIITALTAGTANAQDVVAYIWYEGEDTDCFTNASLKPQFLKTTFEFSIHEAGTT